MRSRDQQPTKAWDRFKDRARDIKTVRDEDCPCPPSDWTVNIGEDDPKR